jgi:hypothetical protein
MKGAFLVSLKTGFFTSLKSLIYNRVQYNIVIIDNKLTQLFHTHLLKWGKTVSPTDDISSGQTCSPFL